MARAAARSSLRQGLDRDVYQVLKKLEDTINDGKPFKTVTAVYEAIKQSNSYLSRSKKQPLQDAIDRVLQIRKEELADSEDSEAELDQPEQPKNPDDERFLLNRQMVKHWATDDKSQTASDTRRPTKKRRVQDDAAEGRDDGMSGNDNEASATATARPNGVAGGSDEAAAYKLEKPTSLKKTPKLTRFEVDHVSDPIPLGGLSDIQKELYDTFYSLLKKDPMMWIVQKWRRAPGFMLAGPAGVGKMSLVRWLAAKLEVAVISLSPCFIDPERIEKSLTEAMDEAVRLAPCILFAERIDDYMSKPGSLGHSEQHDRAVRIFKRQLTRMFRDLPKEKHVVVIATTTSAEDVHPRVFDTGCIEQTIPIRLPDAAAREDIFRVITAGTGMANEVDLKELAGMTHSFVGGDIVKLVTEAQTIAAKRYSPTSKSKSSPGPDVPSDALSSDGPAAPQIPRTNLYEDLTMDDFRVAAKTFVPSLRKQGFSVIPDVGWDQVGALSKVRKQLEMSVVGPIRDPDLYEEWGLERSAGVILWGPPGCGKTLVAQAVANEAQASFILINGPELLNKYVGESERAVRELFQRARSCTPCIIFFDEMDSLVAKRDGGGSGGSEAGVRVVNALLTELDGVHDRTGIYVIGTTNLPDRIDAAMLRPGRLSVRIFVDLPTEDERVDILMAIFRTRRPGDVTAEDLSRIERTARDPRCTDFSGADLKGLYTKAAEGALDRYKAGDKTTKCIDDLDWEEALAMTDRSVKNPELYRKQKAMLGRV